MAYIFRKKFDIRELADIRKPEKRILIAEPQEDLLALYAYHLSRHDFFVRPCMYPAELAQRLADFSPHLLIINSSFYGEPAHTALRLKRLRESTPNLLIVTMGLGTDHTHVRPLMDSAISAHIDRKFSKPADMVDIVHSLLHS